jgi:hypothetical protein
VARLSPRVVPPYFTARSVVRSIVSSRAVIESRYRLNSKTCARPQAPTEWSAAQTYKLLMHLQPLVEVHASKLGGATNVLLYYGKGLLRVAQRAEVLTNSHTLGGRGLTCKDRFQSIVQRCQLLSRVNLGHAFQLRQIDSQLELSKGHDRGLDVSVVDL